MKKITPLFGASLALLSLGISCNDNNDSNSGVYVNMIITDAPTLDEFTEVNLSFAGIKFITDDANYGVQSLESSTSYNFLDLMNGQDSLLIRMSMDYGDTISQVHLVSGSVNELVTSSGETITMDASVAQNYGVYFPVNNYSSSYPSDDFDVIIDINLQKSIQESDGSYSFIPQVRSYLRQGTSYIEGWAQPDSLSFVVSTVLSDGDTVTTISDPSNSNYFRLSGIPSGSYTVDFDLQYSDGTYSQSVTVSDENISLGEVETSL